MKKIFVYCIALILIADQQSFAQKNSLKATVVNRPEKGSNDYYLSNKAPLEPLSFIKLPVGTIKPGRLDFEIPGTAKRRINRAIGHD